MLYEFQIKGRDYLTGKTRVLLADEMGLGKTVQACSALKYLFEHKAIERVLIITPTSLMLNWQYELSKWAPSIPSVLYRGGDRHGMLYGGAKILIGSYETVASDMSIATGDGETYHDIGIDLLILDEAQKIKNQISKLARVISKILAPRRWAISGTPLENRPEELGSLLNFLYPGEFESPDYTDYGKILQLKDQCILRRTKEEVGIQLPPKTVSYVPVMMEPEQSGEYEREIEGIKKDFQKNQSTVNATNLLSAINRLRQIAVIGSEGYSGKLEYLAEELLKLSENNDKAVVFCSMPNIFFPGLIETIRALNPVVYKGDMSVDSRADVEKQFATSQDTKVMLASLKAAGVGLTLTTANHAYIVEPWWNPQVMKQAEDRIHRIGQENPVIIRNLYSPNTVEEGIMELGVSKKDIYDFVINETAAASADKTNMLREIVGV